VVALLFMIWGLVIPLGYSGVLLNGDGDLPRHIVLGGHVLEHGVVFPDVFSNTKPGETFIAYEWLSEVLFALLHSFGGLAAVVIVSSLLIAASVAIVGSFLRRRVETALALLVGNAVAVFTYPHWIARPHLFSFLCLSILLGLSTRDAGWKKYLGLAVLFGFWANLHPGFFYGLAILLAYLVGDSLDHRTGPRFRKNLISLSAALMGTVVNPLGVFLHVNILHHIKDSVALGMVEEFHPPNMASTYGLLFFLSISLIILVLAHRKKAVSFSGLLPFLAAVFAGFAAVRNVPLFALYALPLVVWSSSDVFEGFRWRPLKKPRAVMAADDLRAGTAPWIATITFILLLLLAASGRVGPYQVIRNEFSSETFPVDAVQMARDAGLDDLPVFNEYIWGGYILFSWPGQTIFIDGMANFFGGDLMSEYVSIWLTQEGWKEKLAARGIDLMIIPPDGKLALEASKTSEWSVWYEDSVAMVLRRTASGEDPAGAGRDFPE
ncbi:MAG: hypothetical protein KJN92_02015, partial [Gemmatimonadetes bacterium]|nr:hypothetical protein [Gemmatimonadota bacterium]